MTVQKMLQLMDDCVNGYGNTGAGFRLASGELIGKTGTSQIATENGSGYIEGKNNVITSFAGIYPKSDPQYIIYASVKKPTNGSQKPLSNAVKEIINNIAKYYGTEENNSSSVMIKEYKLSNYVNKKVEDAKTSLDTLGIKYTVIGSGNKIIKQYPEKNDTITSADTLYLITNDSTLTVPNVTGLSSKLAKNLLQKLDIKVVLNGVGYVTEQSIPEGTTITPGMEITLTLNPKFSA